MWCDIWFVSRRQRTCKDLPFPSSAKDLLFFSHVITDAGFASAATHVPSWTNKRGGQNNKHMGIMRETKTFYKHSQNNFISCCFFSLTLTLWTNEKRCYYRLLSNTNLWCWSFFPLCPKLYNAIFALQHYWENVSQQKTNNYLIQAWGSFLCS